MSVKHLLVCVFLVVVDVSSANGIKRPVFDDWLKENAKHYNTAEEYERRFKIFENNLKVIENQNGRNETYKLGITSFADMDFEEFSKLYLMNAPLNCFFKKGNHPRRKGPFPVSNDWNDYPLPVVNGVFDQGTYCASGWAFASADTLASATAILYSTLFPLSAQQLIDCSSQFNNYGCSGGLASNGLEYIYYHFGIAQDKDYPYRGQDGPCSKNSSRTIAYVATVINVTAVSELDMIDVAANDGPMAVGFHVPDNFHLYKSGVYQNDSCPTSGDEVNHVALITGYNRTDDGLRYWMVKNSWGTKWGINGYFWIKLSKNVCGIMNCPTYPIVHDLSSSSLSEFELLVLKLRNVDNGVGN